MKLFSDKFVLIFLAIILISSIGFSFWKYFFAKDYVFTIETECGPEAELCFQRNCSNEECPPNGFENYRVFEINALSFDYCDKETNCKDFCLKNQSSCTEVVCGKNDTDICNQ